MKLLRLFIICICMLAALAADGNSQWKRGAIGLGVNTGVQQYSATGIPAWASRRILRSELQLRISSDCLSTPAMAS